MASLAGSLGVGTKKRNKRMEFPAQEYDPIFKEFAQCLRPKSAAKPLGIRVEAFQSLAKARILKPWFDLPAMAPVYHTDDLDRFNQSVLENAKTVTSITTDYVSLFRLCQHAKCQLEDVVEIAQSGAFGSLCRLADREKIHRCFAYLEDFRDQIQGPAHQGYAKREAKRLLRVNDPTVALLVKNSLLRSFRVRHHRSRRQITMISSEAMFDFIQKYATLGMMANDANTQTKHVATQLDKAGIEPLPLGERYSKIYR